MPRPLNLAAGVSSLLAIAVLAMWVRSHARHEAITRVWHTSTERRRCYVQSLYSSLDFMNARRADAGSPIAATYEYRNWTWVDAMNPRPLQWIPFPPVRFQHIPASRLSYDIQEITIAYWLVLLPTLVLPGVVIAHHRRRRRREKNNLCAACGYDLRATPAKSGPLFDRCPECGAVPASSMIRDGAAT